MAAEDAWPEDIPIWIDGAQKWMTGLTRRTTCDDVIYALLYARGLLDTDSTDNYAVFERWRTVERPLQGRTKIVKVWSAWGAEQPNVQLLVQRLDDYFIPTESARARRRHRRSARQRARHCRCSIGSRTPCTRCRGNEGGGAGTGSRSKAVEQLTRHLVKQERHLQDLKRRVLDTERQIAQHEAKQHARRVQREGIDYVQDSYLIRRFPGSRSGSGSGSSDHSSCTSGSAGSGSSQSLDSLLLAVGEEDLDEYLLLCEDLHEVSQRLEQARYTQNSLAKEIEAEMRSQHQGSGNPKHSFPRTHATKEARDYHHNRDVCGRSGGGSVSPQRFSDVDDARLEENAQQEEKGTRETQLEALQVQLTRAVTANVFHHQQELDIVKEMQVWEARVRDRKRKIRQLLHQLDWCGGNEVENDDAAGSDELLLRSEDSGKYLQDTRKGEPAQMPGSEANYNTGSGRPQHAAFDPSVQSGEKTGGRSPDAECVNNMQSLGSGSIDSTHLLGSSPKNVEYVYALSPASAEGTVQADHSASKAAAEVSCHSLVLPETEHAPARHRLSPRQHEVSTNCLGADSSGLEESAPCESIPSMKQNRAMDNPSYNDMNDFTRSLHSSIGGDRAPPLPPVKARSRSKERNDRRERSKPPVPQPRSRSATRQDSQRAAAKTLFTATSSENNPLNGAAAPTSSDPLTRSSAGPVSSLAASPSSHDPEQRSGNGSGEHFRTFLVGRDVFSAPQPQGEIRSQKSHGPQQTSESSANNFPTGPRAAYQHQQLPGHRVPHYSSSFGESGGHPLGLLFPPSSKDLYSSSKDDSGVASTSSDSSTDSGLLLFDDPAPLRASRPGHTDGPGVVHDADAAGYRGDDGKSVRAGAVPPASSPRAAELPDAFLDVSLSYGDCDDFAYGGDGVLHDRQKSVGYSSDVRGNNSSHAVGGGGGKNSVDGVCNSVGSQVYDGAGGNGRSSYDVSYGGRGEDYVGYYQAVIDDAEMTNTQHSRLQPRHTFTVKMDTHVTDSETRLDTWSEQSCVHDYYDGSPNLSRGGLNSFADSGLSKTNDSSSSSFEKSYRSNGADTKRTQPHFSGDYFNQQFKHLSDPLDREGDSTFTAGAAFEPRKDTASQRSQHQISNEDDNRFLDIVPVIVTNGRGPSPQPVSIISTGKHNKGHAGLNGRAAASRPGKSVRFAENMTSWAWCARHDEDEDEEDVADAGLSSLYGENMLVTLV